MSGLKKIEDVLIKMGQTAVDGISGALEYTDSILDKGRKKKPAAKKAGAKKPAAKASAKKTAAKQPAAKKTAAKTAAKKPAPKAKKKPTAKTSRKK